EPRRPARARRTWKAPAGYRARRNDWWCPRIASAPASAATGWPCSILQLCGNLRADPGSQFPQTLHGSTLLLRPGLAQVEVGPLVACVGIDRRQLALVPSQFVDRQTGQRSILTRSNGFLEGVGQVQRAGMAQADTDEARQVMCGETVLLARRNGTHHGLGESLQRGERQLAILLQVAQQLAGI